KGDIIMKVTHKRLAIGAIGLLIAALVSATIAYAYGTGNKKIGIMTKDELKAVMGDKQVVILDVRTGRDWSNSEFKIKGAMRVDQGRIDATAEKLDKGDKIVLYCA
ncbi:MAG: hypothetical protein MI749_09180, partial [Desulfovibrionales bacterium]|nr:hypothetical protein [Desulfovibrionales bacterium]